MILKALYTDVYSKRYLEIESSVIRKVRETDNRKTSEVKLIKRKPEVSRKTNYFN